MRQEAPRWPSSQRWVIMALAVVVLAVLGQLSLAAADQRPWLRVQAQNVNGKLTVTGVQPAGVAWYGGIRPRDVITAMAERPITTQDGPAVIDTASAIQVRTPSGLLLRTSIAGTEYYSPQFRLSVLVIAFSSVAFGGIVFLLMTEATKALIALGFGTTAGAGLVTAIATSSGSSWALAVEYISVVGFGAGTFLLFLVFPVDRLRTRYGRWVAMRCLGLSALLVLLYGWVFFGDSAAYDLIRPAAFTVVVTGLAGAATMLILAIARDPTPQSEARAL